MNANTSSDALPGFVSQQVTEAQRFFLNLKPNVNSPLEIVCGGVERMRPDYVVSRNDFPYFAIELVAEGEGSLSIGGSEHRLTAGVLFAYGPGVSHTIRNRSAHGMRKYYLDLVGTNVPKMIAGTGMRDRFGKSVPITVGATHELTELFEMLIRDARDEGPFASSICESVSQLLMLKIRQLRLPEGRPLSKAYATYERVRRHIEQNHLRIQTIEEVADECDLSPVYLSRLFGRYADCGAYKFLMRHKMNYAAGLLMNEGMMVKEVARRLGFEDPFQFSRAFKRVYGVPPQQLAATGR